MDVKAVDQIVEENREEALEFLVGAIQTPRVTGDEWAISQYFKHQMEKMELDIEVHALDETRPNLIATWKGSDGPTFLFNGHYDVFPPLENDPGLYGPWSGKIVDGYIYGRGTVDMTSGLCASVMAVQYLQKLGFKPKGNVVLSCDVDEESGGKYGVEYLLDKGLLNADFGICMEPTRSKIQVENGGGVFLKITYKSKSWHGGIRRDERDALQKAVTAANELYKFDEKLRKERYYEPFKGGAFLSINELYAGQTMNIHASKSELIIDRRLIPGETPEKAQEEIREILNYLQKKYGDMDYELEMLCRMPPRKLEESDPLIIAGLESYKEVYGKSTELYKRPGGADSCKIVEKYGMCMPSFGPGLDMEETASANEKLWVDDYINFIKVYMLLITKMMK